MTIEIPLSKQGSKYKGLYFAIVDDEDEEFAELNFRVVKSKTTKAIYAATGDEPTKSLHRLVLEKALGYPLTEGEFPDHIDGNGLNCTRGNLRKVNKSQNGMNRGAQSNNKTGYKGVSWHKHRKKYRARIFVEGKEISLGYFIEIEDAIKARDDAERLYFKEYGRPNKPILSE